jgi:Lon protease-like protein
LPGQIAPLHIFEKRYLELVKDCQAGQEFGINFTNEAGMAVMGCSLKVINVQQTYDDGKLDIIAKGLNRYKLESIIKEKSYDQVEIEYVEDSGLYTLSDPKIAEFKKGEELEHIFWFIDGVF